VIDTPKSLMVMAGRKAQWARGMEREAVVHLDAFGPITWAIGHGYEMQHAAQVKWTKAAMFLLMALR
jgi:hypothetical protein